MCVANIKQLSVAHAFIMAPDRSPGGQQSGKSWSDFCDNESQRFVSHFCYRFFGQIKEFDFDPDVTLKIIGEKLSQNLMTELEKQAVNKDISFVESKLKGICFRI